MEFGKLEKCLDFAAFSGLSILRGSLVGNILQRKCWCQVVGSKACWQSAFSVRTAFSRLTKVTESQGGLQLGGLLL